MADEAIGLAHAASIPRSRIVGVARAEGSIVSVEVRIVLGKFITKFFCLLIVIGVSLSIVLSEPSPWMARATIPDKKERGFVNF
jgi:hypothetical protein